MAKYISDAIANRRPPVTGDGAGEVLNAKYTCAVDASLALGDLILLGKLPAGHEPVSGFAYSTDLDSSTGLVMTFGILNDAATDIVSGADFLTTSTIGQSGAMAALDGKGGLNLTALNALATTDVGTGGTVSAINGNAYVNGGDRVIVAKVTTAATGTKAAGTVGISINYKAV
jgi:hypothetical protein